MIKKQGDWVPYELTPRNVERRFSTCEILLSRHKRKGFIYRIVTDDEKWIHYDNPKRKKSWNHLSMLQNIQLNQIFMEKNSCCVFGAIFGVVHYDLLKPKKTITGAVYRT